MAKIISIVSGKGGVGKTTTVSNLGVALADHGRNVIILDANVTTPNLSLHLGIPFYPITLHDVLKKKIPIESALYDHPSGIKIVPASLSSDAMKGVNMEKLEGVLWSLLGKADIIIIDSAAGLGKEAQTAIEVADELLIVTNPDLPAVTDALKAVKLAEDNGTKILGVVVNRVREQSHELSLEEISSMLEVPIIAVVPEDVYVPRSISKKIPLVHYKPSSDAAKEFKKLAKKIMGESTEVKRRKNWVKRLFFWIR